MGMADVNTFPVALDLTDLRMGKEEKKAGGGLFGIGKKKMEEVKKVDEDALMIVVLLKHYLIDGTWPIVRTTAI